MSERMIKRLTKTKQELAEIVEENENLKTQIKKVKYTLNKIIETVHNDKISEYGARLVLIHDFAYECLEEVSKC